MEAIAEAAKAAEPENEDAAIEKALKIPKLKAALTEADQRMSQAVNVANEFARASFIQNFPEIAGLPLEQWDGALTAMAQREPERFNRAITSLQNVLQLEATQTGQQQRATQQRQAELQEYAKAESEKFEDSIKNVPTAERRAIETSIVDAIKEHGGDLEQFTRLMKTSEFASSAVQGLLWELGELREYHRKMTSAKAAISARSLPPVIRPGIARSARERSGDDVASLNQRLSQSGSIDDAAKLLAARRKAGG